MYVLVPKWEESCLNLMLCGSRNRSLPISAQAHAYQWIVVC